MTPQQALLCIAAGIALLRFSRQRRPSAPSSDVQRSQQASPDSRPRGVPSGFAVQPRATDPSAGHSSRWSAAALAHAPVWARIAVLSAWVALLIREASLGNLLPAWGSVGAAALVAIAASSVLLVESLVDARTAIGGQKMPKGLPADLDSHENDSAHHRLASSAPRPDFSGTWIKDFDASTSMAPVIEEMKLNGFTRTAIRLVRGVRIKQNDDSFEFGVFSVIKWFKVVEKYPFSGEEKQFQRRDLRRGRHTGSVEWTVEGNIRLTLSWEDPFSGQGTDVFRLITEDELHVTSTMCRNGKELQYNTVYKRQS